MWSKKESEKFFPSKNLKKIQNFQKNNTVALVISKRLKLS